MIRDVMGLGTLPEITGELTAVADAIVEVAYERIYQDLVAQYGQPRSDDDSRSPSHFAVIALGKMGGEELNYSSDIDLMFLYLGQTARPPDRPAYPTRNSSSAQRISSPGFYPPIPRKECVIAWICACAPTEAWARSAYRSTARKITTKSARAIGSCRC